MIAKTITKAVKPLIGQLCWGIRYDRNLNLSMNFGKPSLEILREPYPTTSPSEAVQRLAASRRVRVQGEWWLWLFCCYWQIHREGLRLATGSSSFRRIERAMALLKGQKLLALEINAATGASRFLFDLGCTLACRRFERNSADELWLLYKPSGYVLSVHGNGTYCHQRGTEKGEQPRPIEGGVPADGR